MASHISGDTPVRRIPRIVLAAIFITAASITALDDAFQTYPEARQMRRDVHAGILQHTASAPERYRVLVAYVVEGAIRLATPFVSYDSAFATAYAVFYLLGFAWLLWAQFAYLRVWFTDEQALLGALLVGCTLRLTMQEYTPFSVLEPGFFAFALLLSLKQRRVWLAALVAIASLNRETGVFLPMLYAATSPVTRKNAVTTVALFAIWALVFFGVRFAAGEATRVWTLDSIWTWNRHPAHLLLTAQNALLLLGAVWLFAALGYRRSSPFVRRSAIVIAPYLVTVLIWGTWSEIRLVTPLYPILLSLALAYLFGDEGGSRPFDRRWVRAAILATAVGVNAYQYSFLVTRAPLRRAMHDAVLNHTAPAPLRYHILVPYALEAPMRAAAHVMRPEKAFGRVYAAYHLAALWALLMAQFVYFRRWFSDEGAMIGVLLVGTVIRLALRQGEYIGLAPIPLAGVFAPHSLLEPTIVAMALLFILDRRGLRLGFLTAAAALNSELALLIPLLYFAAQSPTRRTIAAAATYTATAAGVLIAVRVGIGGPWLPAPLAQMWQENLGGLPTAAVNVVLLLGGAWGLAIRGLTYASPFLVRVARVVPVFALAFALTALWSDVRLLMPLYVLVVPLALAYVLAGRPGVSEAATRRHMIAPNEMARATATGTR